MAAFATPALVSDCFTKVCKRYCSGKASRQRLSPREISRDGQQQEHRNQGGKVVDLIHQVRRPGPGNAEVGPEHGGLTARSLASIRVPLHHEALFDVFDAEGRRLQATTLGAFLSEGKKS